MLVFVDAKLTLFAVPKTGSTAYHLALKGKADIAFVGKQAMKHMPLRKYDRHFAPFLQEAFGLAPERVAVIRHPVEQIRSWYKYRSRGKVRGGNAVPEGMSFDDFVAETISAQPHPCAKLGSQFTFLTSEEGALRTDHLFAYERQTKLMKFLQDRIGKPFETQRKNVSPERDAPLSAAMEADLRVARPEEFALYDRVMAQGGYLHTPIAH
jgi:hypothetical protein